MSEWYEEGKAPWFEIENFSEIILDKVDFLDILDRYGIEYEKTYVGNFTHKLRCPMPNHMDGNERTASCFISQKNNSFHCFGCNAGNTVVNFVSLYKNTSYYAALEELSEYVGLIGSDLDLSDHVIKKRNPEFTILPYIFKSSVIIREHLKYVKNSKNYNKWCKWCNWADKKFIKMNYFMEKLEDDDWERAKKYYENIIAFIIKTQ